jgi:hypothetical protein
MQELMGSGPAADEAARLAQVVAENYRVPYEAIMSRDRSTVPSAARTIVAKLLREQGYSLPEIGDALNRNHTSVMRAVRITDKDIQRTLTMALQSRAEAEAARVIVAQAAATPGAKSTGPRREPGDRDRILWAKAIEQLRETPEADRGLVWGRFARAIFPHDHVRQAATMPRL